MREEAVECKRGINDNNCTTAIQFHRLLHSDAVVRFVCHYCQELISSGVKPLPDFEDIVKEHYHRYSVDVDIERHKVRDE